MSAENKAIIQRFYEEVINQGKIDLLEELMAVDYVEHGNPAASGMDGFRKFVRRLGEAFPDLQIKVEDMVAEGDKVTARVTVRATHLGLFMGKIQPTGRAVTFNGIDIFQIAGGKIAGRWNQRDLLGLLQQLGVANLPG